MNVRLLEAAFSLAAHVHVVQLRKGSKVPYMAHLLGVAELVWTNDGTDEEVAAALLHDAVEDGGGEAIAWEIDRKCGPGVAAIVRACSDSVTTTSGAEKEDWWTRKTRYIDHLRDDTPSDGALLVSASDKLHNLTATRRDYDALGEEVWSRFKSGWQGQLWYFRSLLEAYETVGDRRVQRVAERIRFELAALDHALRQAGHDLTTVRGTRT